MLPRACAASRTAIIASRSRPSAAGSMSAWKPRITPDCRRARTRARQVDGATPTRSASALLGTRASTASSCRIARSTGSSGRRTLFGPSGIVDPDSAEKSATPDSSESSSLLLPAIVRFFTLALHEDRDPHRGQEPRVPGRADPGRCARARRVRPRGARPGRRRAGQRAAGRRVRRGGRADRRRRGRRLGGRRPAAQGQGTRRRGVPPAAQGPGALHLPAPGRLPRVHRRPARLGHHRDRLRDGAAARPVPAPARPDERGRGPARPAGRRVPPHAPRGRARRADGRRAGRPRRGRRRHRRRRGGAERRRDRRWAWAPRSRCST